MSADYPPPLAKLCALGNIWETEEQPDYVAMGIGPEHISDLIRMAMDEELNQADSESPAVWAPVHAFRALGQLRAEEAIEPLLNLFRRVDEFGDDAIGEDLPEAYGRIGAPAIPALSAYLADPQHGLWARVAAATSLGNIAKRYPETRDQVVAALTQTLERFSDNDPALNGSLVSDLVELKATEVAPLIERAFAADQVDEMVRGDWEDVQIDLGLKTERTTPPRTTWLDRLLPQLSAPVSDTSPAASIRARDLSPSAPFPVMHTNRKAERKAKSKRKQAAKMRKKNRRRK